jgi:uracil-DNA glycosylase family 4
MPMEAPARHRLLLSLRSESAMGLRSVRGVAHGPVQPDLPDEESETTREISGRQHSIGVTARVSPPAVAELFPTAPVVPAATVISSPQLSAIELPLMTTREKTVALATMNENEVRSCKKCRLCETRTQTVFGEGDVDAKIFFIGEGPGEDEDRTGRPFVGRSGQLLEKMIIAMGLSRAQVFIANIVKCRPPNNRVPAPDEVATCTPYLTRQLEIIRPKVIVTLGLPSVKYMLGDPKLTMGRTRGQWHAWRGIKLMPTYHPSFILRSYTEENRKAVWNDLQMVMKEIGLESSRAKPKS